MSIFKELTLTGYKDIARNMPIQELMTMADTYNECQSLGAKDVVIKDILNAEVERRINHWEATE